jgi:hypothetical protein
MSKEQIEEMAKAIAVKRGYGCDERDSCDMSCPTFKCGCFPYEDAQFFYDAGYRKQSEWISVDERLPDNCRAVLVALEGLTIAGAPAMVIGSYSGGFWMVADADGTHYLTKYMRYKVTHWMPLPEPPKGV